MTPATEKWVLKYLVRQVHQMWKWYPVRKSKKYPKGATHLECEKCGRKRKLTAEARKLYEVDHVEPVGRKPRALAEFVAYVERKFCSPENMALICRGCHKEKSSSENEDRVKENRAARWYDVWGQSAAGEPAVLVGREHDKADALKLGRAWKAKNKGCTSVRIVGPDGSWHDVYTKKGNQDG